MGRLDEDTKLVKGDVGFEARIPPDWFMYLSPSGGFLAALALRAAGEKATVRFPVSFSCVFAAVPTMDAALTLDVTTLKSGKRSEAFRVTMTQSGRTILEAHVWACAEAGGVAHDQVPMPSARRPLDLPKMEDLPPDQQHPPAPFWTNLEERWDDWAFRVVRPPRHQGWFKFQPQATSEDPFVDASRPLMLIDALVFGAAMGPHPDNFMPSTSLDLNVHFHRSSWPLSDYLYAQVEAPIASCGRIGGSGRVWDADGRLIASGTSQMLNLVPLQR